MAIRWVSNAWKNSLKTAAPDERYYLGFRKKEYPALDGSDDTYTLITSTDNQAGSHNLTGGHIQSLVTFPDSGTIEVRVYPNFEYDTANTQAIYSWYYDADNRFLLYYNDADDTFKVLFTNDGNPSVLTSDQFDDGSSHTDINQWLTFTVAWDNTAGTASLWVNRVLTDSWAGVDPAAITYNIFKIREGSPILDPGDYKINYLRFFPDYKCDDDDVQNAFKDVENEEIVWYLNGVGLGRDRCNISRYVLGSNKKERVANSRSSDCANGMGITLYSPGGIFADDQYAAFDPTAEQFNGTSAQAYLKRRSHVFVENWYGTDFEPVFVGLVTSGYQRSTPVGGTTTRGRQTVSIGCHDHIAELAKRVRRNGEYWEDKKLADDVETDSLVHLYVKAGMNREVYNFLANSSFENATISNSWIDNGDCSISRDAVEYFHDTHSCKADWTGAGYFYQDVTFDNMKKLNKYETWNFSIFAKSASGCTFTLSVIELDSAGSNDSTSALCTLDGGEEWVRFNCSHTITDSDSDQIRVYVSDTANPLTIYFDAAMLVQSDTPPNFIVENTTDGTAGVIDAKDAGSDDYERIGFDVEEVDITHPWARMEEGDRPWTHLKQISLACGATIMGIDQAGTFKLRGYLGEDADPTPVTITTARDIKASLNCFHPNKLVGHGVNIIESSIMTTLWTAESKMLTNLIGAHEGGYGIANGSSWPAPATYPEFWAKYEV